MRRTQLSMTLRVPMTLPAVTFNLPPTSLPPTMPPIRYFEQKLSQDPAAFDVAVEQFMQVAAKCRREAGHDSAPSPPPEPSLTASPENTADASPSPQNLSDKTKADAVFRDAGLPQISSIDVDADAREWREVRLTLSSPGPSPRVGTPDAQALSPASTVAADPASCAGTREAAGCDAKEEGH